MVLKVFVAVHICFCFFCLERVLFEECWYCFESEPRPEQPRILLSANNWIH